MRVRGYRVFIHGVSYATRCMFHIHVTQAALARRPKGSRQYSDTFTSLEVSGS